MLIFRRKLYGRYAANMMKTDVHEADIDLPGFKKEELSLELKDGYLAISAAKGLDEDVKQEDIHAKYERWKRVTGRGQDKSPAFH